MLKKDNDYYFEIQSEIDIIRNFMVPMRDGTKLATDIYLPRSTKGPHPTLLERTPYNKCGTNRAERTLASPEPISKSETAINLAKSGFAVVLQDCRGRYNSEGYFKKYVNEAEDGYDTVTWILNQIWCNGKIGTYGLSYGAHVQGAIASINTPGICGMLMESGAFYSAFDGGIRQGGAYEMKQVTWALSQALVAPETNSNPSRKRALEEIDLSFWFRNPNWSKGNSPLSPAPEYEEYMFEQWENGIFDDYWKQKGLYCKGYLKNYPKSPVLLMTGWYDPYASSTIDTFDDLNKINDKAFLLIGPWTHGQRSVSFAGDIDLGDDAIFDNHFEIDFLEFRKNWFRHCLDNDLCPLSKRVNLFIMGGGTGKRLASGKLDHGGKWISQDDWPLENCAKSVFYFSDENKLTSSLCAKKSASLTYESDPSSPVPTIGGAITSGAPIMEGGAFNQIESADFFGCVAPFMKLCQRKDILVFETDCLRSPITVIGKVWAKIWASSNCIDTDFTFKLVDVYPSSEDYPNGYDLNLCHGILRARFRNGFEKENFMIENEIYELEIEGFPTANKFEIGHKIRVEIASSNYPHFDINPNSGEKLGSFEKPRVATNTIYMDIDHPSCIVLNVLTEQTD